MDETVPHDAYEANESVAIACDRPPEPVRGGEVYPIPLGRGEQACSERRGMEFVDLVVGEAAPPLVAHIHVAEAKARMPLPWSTVVMHCEYRSADPALEGVGCIVALLIAE